MLHNIPQLGRQSPNLVCTLSCLTPILIQVFDANTLYVAESSNALVEADDAGTINAFQINKQTGPYTLWWKGDLWVAGSAAFRCIIGIPGVNTDSGLAGSSGEPANVLAGGL